jgi:hypothetical protein
MVLEVSRRVCDGHKFKYLVHAGLAWLEHNKERVNQLNVYPVPDGDTGTNMWHTFRRAYSEIAEVEEAHVGKVAELVAKGALRGARGNSGTILSEIFRGLARGLKDREVFDARTLAYACKIAIETAYQALEKPVEGTILTVARAAGEAAIRIAQEENDLQVVLEVMLATAQDALRRTPDQLEILRKAGVVDSGGQGLVYIIEGMVRLLQGEPVMMFEMEREPANTAQPHLDGTWDDMLEPESEEGYGYDVQFLIKGENLSVQQIRKDLEDMQGWSIVVIGDENLVKVHVHLSDPGVALTYGVKLGQLDDLVVENMQLQYEAQIAKRVRKEEEEAFPEVEGVAVITVAAGDGLKRVMRGSGAAYVISGGQTMNPSAEDFLNAINSISNTDIVLLPNNSNIILTAKQAAKLVEGKRVTVVPSRTLPQGISAMLAYYNAHEMGADLDEITRDMTDALNNARTIEITTSTRAITLDGVTVAEGQIIGLLDDKLAASGETLEEVVENTLEVAGAEDAELITLYFGWDVREQQANKMAEAIRERFGTHEVQVMRGGQPLYPYIISVE